MQKKLTIKNDINQLQLVSEFLELVGEEWGLDIELIWNLNLVLEEAVSNIIFYAYPGEVDQKIDITLTIEGNVLEIVLADSGRAFDPTLKKEPDISLPPEQREIGGLGIFLVRKLMGEVTYYRTNGRNILTMRKELLTVE